ncbi:hypothetical protein BDY21DRAFT_187658 [Lineolata rhizophorae]|uniref:Uncharacterized protein n=1 Tax=Lineolata rhizophorae TaxID=578093 RepID=A0A6A6P5W6_9PEZI|nr:hypothetical protein BDY21DRAFT_187658 [Lineolata rhizophorae]
MRAAGKAVGIPAVCAEETSAGVSSGNAPPEIRMVRDNQKACGLENCANRRGSGEEKVLTGTAAAADIRPAEGSSAEDSRRGAGRPNLAGPGSMTCHGVEVGGSANAAMTGRVCWKRRRRGVRERAGRWSERKEGERWVFFAVAGAKAGTGGERAIT